MELQAIGRVHSAYKNLADIPRQGCLSDTVSEIEIFSAFTDGLLHIEHNRYLIVLYWAHLARRDLLKTIPPRSSEIRGVFASRSPGRPNPLSLCVTELISCAENLLRVRNLDALDGSSVIDIKPYTAMDAISMES